MALTGWTNRGLKAMLDIFFRGATPPTDLYVALVTAATAPSADINTLSELTEIAAGNGYTAGGVALNRDATDWDTLTQDNAYDEAYGRAKDVSWTASGGAIPASGSGASYAVLTDDNATVGSREVYAWWPLGAVTTVDENDTLALADLETSIKHTPLTYLFLARFETDQAAPLGTPLACEVGELAVIDTGNNLSISGGEMVAASSGGYDPRLTADSVHVRAAGLATVFEVTIPNTANDVRVALEDATTGNTSKNALAFNASQQRYLDNTAGSEIRYYYDNFSLTVGGTYRFCIVLRAAGAFFLGKGGTELPDWTLLMVTAGDTTTPLHETVTWRLAGGSKVLTIGTALLPGNLATDYDLATARTAVNVAGDTLTAESDALLEWTFTAVNAQTHSLEFRRADADNLWRVDCNVLTQTVSLVRREGAVETVEASDSVSLSVGSAYRLVVACSGGYLRAWLAESGGPNVQANSTFNQTATGVRASTAGTDLIAWPRDLDAAEAGLLDVLSFSATTPGTVPEEPPEEPPPSTTGLWTAAEWEDLYRNTSYDATPSATVYETDRATDLGYSGNPDARMQYWLGYDMDGYVAWYQATGNLLYLHDAFEHTYRVIATSKLSSALPNSQFKDSYRAWAAAELGGQEAALYESYLWRYIARALRIVKETPAIHSQIYSGSTTYLQVYTEVFAWMITNIWNKWRARGLSWLYRSRTHMAAHWLYIAMEIYQCSTDATVRAQAQEVITKINTDLSPYFSSSMRGQLFAHPLDATAYAFNGVWGLYTLPAIEGNDDWAHHQNTISALVEGYQLGIYWTLADMQAFARLARNVLWNQSITNPQFYYYLKPEGMGAGYLGQSEGTVKLALFDPTYDLQRAMQNYRLYGARWTQLWGNAALNAKTILGG